MKYGRSPRTKVSEFPTIKVAVPPHVLEALEDEAEAKSLPLSAVVRAALDRAVNGTTSLKTL